MGMGRRGRRYGFHWDREWIILDGGEGDEVLEEEYRMRRE
jgi:hypothetical protein